MKINFKDKKTIFVLIVILILFASCSQDGTKDSDSSSSGDGTITSDDIKTSGGGGGGGGVPPSGDPDEPCENCELIWIENALSNLGPGFNIPEYLTTNGRKVTLPAGKDAPAGHWECRGDCPDKNGYKQTCKPRPVRIDPADFNNMPHSKQELGQLMECYCTLEDPCHMEYGNIFCERGIPEEILQLIVNTQSAGQYMGMSYADIREHCKIATCQGGCPNSGEKCVFDTASDGSTICKCNKDTCRKEYINIPTRTQILNNIDYNVVTVAKISDFADLTQKTTSFFRCVGNCVDSNKECAKVNNDCACVEKNEAETGIPKPTTCSQITVSGDYDWWKCLEGYCQNTPYCFAGTSFTRGWYLGNTLLKADSDCQGCVAYCGAIGTRSQGWYDSCDDSLISYDSTCDDASPCFFNGYTGKCQCTPYTDNCAWEVDWQSFDGPMSDSNHPYRNCEGSCYDVSVLKECKEVYAPYGDVCECIPEEGYEGTQDDDMDNDGIPDNVDACPTTPGFKIYNGCYTAIISPLTSTTTTTTTFDRILR